MVGYFCATPLHVLSAITMQGGMFADEDSMLILLNHFHVDEALLGRIKESGVFTEVMLVENDYRTTVGNIKRLANAFFPIKPMRYVANKTCFTHFVCFALDYIDLAYIMTRYKKRGIRCEFSFGDDGIGTYIAEIHQPKPLARKLLKLNGHLGILDEVTRLYAYKPEYLIVNRHFDVQPILQNEAACRARCAAAAHIWPLQEQTNIDGGVLYFEQPNPLDADNSDRDIEQAMLRRAMDTLGIHAAVKMHPRSDAEAAWSPFGVIHTKMPYEVMLQQAQCKPKLIMTISSTALFNTYMFDDLTAEPCPAILLYKMMRYVNRQACEAMTEMCERINAAQEKPRIYVPENEEELQKILEIIKD